MDTVTSRKAAAAFRGRAPEVSEFADWLTAKLHLAEIVPGLRIVRRGREAGSLVAACVAPGILSPLAVIRSCAGFV